MITHDVAITMMAEMRRTARDRELVLALCIVDDAGELVAFERMDGVGRISVELAQRKACTAALWRMTTAELNPLVQPGAALYGATHLDGGRFIAFGGGVPLRSGSGMAGGIGVSGSSSAVDAEVAAVGAACFDAA